MTVSQFSISIVERNDAFDIAARIENANLTGAKACAILRVIDCLICLQENRLDAGRFKNFPDPLLVRPFALRGLPNPARKIKKLAPGAPLNAMEEQSSGCAECQRSSKFL